MWERVSNDGPGLLWVKEAIAVGSAVWVTDGSYNREKAPTVSGAGWVLHCTRSGHRLRGSFYEVSPFASSYRAELLGLLAVHTLATAFASYFNLGTPSSEICCDSRGALSRSGEIVKRVPSGSSNADVQRCLRNCKLVGQHFFEYTWVESHQDKIKPWDELILRQQFNCICDAMAKSAVWRALPLPHRDAVHQQLPFERASVIVDGVKQTTSAADALRFSLAKQQASHFYTAELGWTAGNFNAVGWEELDAALSNKPQMYKQWLAKQASGFCGTQRMVSRWNDARDDRCPDCGLQETSAHILHCPARERTQLLHDQADDLSDWLADHDTHPDINYWLPRYIKLRGARQLSSFSELSPGIRRFAEAQDSIGWRNFMEGKIAKELFSVQRRHLAGISSRTTPASWAKQVVSHVLHISHSQWLFRNESLHHASTGYLRLQRRRDLLHEIGKLADLDPKDVPESRRHLLEVDFSRLASSSDVSQTYWVYAVQAAQKAGQRRAKSRRKRGNGARGRRAAAHTERRRSLTRTTRVTAVEAQIAREFAGTPLNPRKERLSQRATEVAYGSNKRRKPD
jgi:hypothetical protein